MLPGRLLRVGGVVGWLGCACAAAIPGASGPPAGKSTVEDPPWRRVLTPADAARVRKLEKARADFLSAGKLPEGIQAAQAILKIRVAAQGVSHWQAVDARRVVERLKWLSRATADQQAALARALHLNREAEGLRQRRQYRDAE